MDANEYAERLKGFDDFMKNLQGVEDESPVKRKPAAALESPPTKKRRSSSSKGNADEGDDPDEGDDDPPEQKPVSAEDALLQQLTKENRKLCATQTQILKYKTQMERCKNSKGIHDHLKANHKEAEDLRNAMIAGGKDKLDKKEAAKHLKLYTKFAEKAKQAIQKAKPWVPK